MFRGERITITRQKWAADWDVEVPPMDVCGVQMFAPSGEPVFYYEFIESYEDRDVAELERLWHLQA